MATFEKIAFTEVGSGGQASITFNTIPSTFTDLVIKLSAATNRSDFDSFKVRFNGSSSTYSGKVLYGGGSGSGASFNGQTTYLSFIAANGSNYASTFSSTDIYIPNYASSNNKSTSTDSVTEANATGAEMGLSAGLWSTTTAINSITIEPNVGTLILQYSTATLYGIKKA
jgi:hypothetical protein